jgi:hypothetical protein
MHYMSPETNSVVEGITKYGSLLTNVLLQFETQLCDIVRNAIQT